MLDEMDLALMRLTQAGLPLVFEPYQYLANQLNTNAKDIMARLEKMQHNGVIRRIGVVPNHYKLGYLFNGMSVWNVDDEKIDTLGAQVGALDFVSHCYHRPRHPPYWNYNLFAMIHAKDKASANQKIAIIAEILKNACSEYDVLFSTKILKKTGFRSVKNV